MKKTLKITGIILIVLVIAVLCTPFIFKGKLLEITKKEINNYVTAKVDFSDFDVSIISNFPNLTITLENLEIVGSKQFAKDTLAAIKELQATVDIMSVINGDSIGITKIALQTPRLHILTAADSSVNYDIMKPSAPDTTVDTTTTKFSLQLKSIEIHNAYIYYEDIPGDMSSEINDINLSLSGNFTESSTLLTTNIEASELSFTMENIPYLVKTKFNLDAIIDADFVHEKYTLKDNKMSINNLDLNYTGWLAFKGDDMVMDFSFKTMKTDFKNILSLVPGIYTEGFEDIKTSGKLSFDGFVKGTYSDAPETYPSFKLRTIIENGKFQYPDLPKSVDNIQMNLLVENKSNNLDSTIIDLQKFSVSFAQNPFEMTFFMKYPMSDPYMKSNISGTIDLNSLRDFIPLDSMSITGIIKPQIEFASVLSDIENENYNKIKALGNIDITNFSYKDSDFPQGIQISTAKMLFSPQFVDLQQCLVKFGESDFALQGKLENFLAYALADETIKGTLNLQSKFMDLNEIMGEDSTETTETETSTSEPIVIPANIDFVLQSTIGRLIYDVYDITNVSGKITIKDQKLQMDNLKMNMLGGNLGLSGYFSTPKNAKPDAKFALDIKNFEIAQTFKTFNTVQKLAPIAKYLQGTFSTKLDFKSIVDNDFMPDLSTLNGFGEFNATTLGMKGTPLQKFAVNTLKQNDLKDIVVKNILMFFSIENGNVVVKPFETNFNNNKAIIEGKSGLNESLDYKVAMQIPRSNFGGTASNALQTLTSVASAKGINADLGEFIDLTLLVTGTMSNPKFTPVLGNVTSGVFNSIKDQAKQRLLQEQERAKQAAQAKIDAAKLQAQQAADAKKKEMEAKAKAEVQKQTTTVKKEVSKQTDAIKKDAKKQLGNVLKQ